MPVDLGFCAHDAIAYPALADQEMAAVQDLGGHRVRIGMWWALVEETKGKLTGYPAASTYPNKLPRGFDQIDIAVNAALTKGLDVLLLLNNPVPAWASNNSAADYASFCAKAAQRYQPGGTAITPANAGKGVVRYEILNEVNVYSFWNTGGFLGWQGGVNIPQIAAFHRAAYTSIKAVQPAAEVGGWGMAAVIDWPGGWFSAGPNQISPDSFVKQMIDGRCGPVDFITYHPYTLASDFSTWQPPSAQHPFIVQIQNIRNVLIAERLPNLPLDLTEWGYPTSTFTPQQQADCIRQEWEILHSPAYAPLIRDLYLYCARDFPMPTETWSPINQEHTYGILRQDFSYKPAAQFLKGLP